MIPYKGPLLAKRFYDRFDLRHTGNLDIIVPFSAYQQAKALLIAEDFECPPMTEAEESHLLRTSQELKLWREQDKVAIEIHWAVSPHFFMFPFEQLRLWDHCQWHDIGNDQFRLPPLEDKLLLLCVHGTQHAWAKLKWVSDIAEILRRPQFLDWEVALARARDLHSERMLLLGLWLAHELLGAPLPEVILAAVQRDAVVKTLSAQVTKRLRCGQEQPPMLTIALFHLRTKEHLSDRCQYVIRFARDFISRHWQQTSPSTASPKSFHFAFVRRSLALLSQLGQKTLKTWREALLDHQNARKNAA